MRRIMLLVTVALVMAALTAVTAGTAFAGGGGALNCSTSGVIETCRGGGGSGGAGYGEGNIGGGGGGGATSSYNTETGDLVFHGGFGFGGSSVGGAGGGGSCSINNFTGEGECVGGGSPEEDSN